MALQVTPDDCAVAQTWVTTGSGCTADFFPVSCCFPTCRSIAYLLVDRKPERTDVVPIPRLINLDEYLDYVTNRVMPDQAVRAALEKLWSASAFMGADTTARSLEITATELECAACGIDLPQAVKELDERTFMIVMQDFQTRTPSTSSS